MKPLRLDEEAAGEIVEAIRWYEQQRRGLGSGLRSEARAMLDTVRARPLTFARLSLPETDLEFRRALLRRFPYAFVFMDLPEEIRVVAFVHQRRRPGYWLNRVETSSD